MKKLGIILSLASLLLGVSTVPAYAHHNGDDEHMDKDIVHAKVTLGESSNTAVDPVCMQNAIEKRDTAIITAFDTYHGSVRAALIARKDALKAAWAITDKDGRGDALLSAWKTWYKAVRDARKAFRDARKSVWHNFEIDRKACGARADASIHADANL